MSITYCITSSSSLDILCECNCHQLYTLLYIFVWIIEFLYFVCYSLASIQYQGMDQSQQSYDRHSQYRQPTEYELQVCIVLYCILLCAPVYHKVYYLVYNQLAILHSLNFRHWLPVQPIRCLKYSSIMIKVRRRKQARCRQLTDTVNFLNIVRSFSTQVIHQQTQCRSVVKEYRHFHFCLFYLGYFFCLNLTLVIATTLSVI